MYTLHCISPACQEEKYRKCRTDTKLAHVIVVCVLMCVCFAVDSDQRYLSYRLRAPVTSAFLILFSSFLSSRIFLFRSVIPNSIDLSFFYWLIPILPPDRTQDAASPAQSCTTQQVLHNDTWIVAHLHIILLNTVLIRTSF